LEASLPTVQSFCLFPALKFQPSRLVPLKRLLAVGVCADSIGLNANIITVRKRKFRFIGFDYSRKRVK
jgi:hypothetical protein